jgi:hypothetical protein
MQLALRKEEYLVIGGDARSLSILCTAGSLWITQDRDMNDHVLNGGQVFTIDRKGRITLQALQDAQFNMIRWGRKKMKWQINMHS